MIDTLEQARSQTEVCEDILRSPMFSDYQHASPGLEQAYQNALQSIEVLYFSLSEVINMQKMQNSHKSPILKVS